MTDPIPEYKHLHPDVVHRMQDSPEDRKALILQKVFQRHDMVNDAIKLLDAAIRRPPRKRSPMFSIIADPGMGKTELFNFVASMNKSEVLHGGIITRPVVYFEIPGVNNRDEFAAMMERALGLPRGKGTPLDRVQHMVDLLNRCRCRMAFFDEFQDVLSLKGVDSKAIIMLLKRIANEALFPLCVMGSREIRTIFSDEPHMAARFPHVIKFEPWKADSVFHSFLFSLVRRYPIKQPSLIFDNVTLQEIIMRSKGNTECIVIAAQETACEGIDLAHAKKDPSLETIEREAFLGRLLS